MQAPEVPQDKTSWVLVVFFPSFFGIFTPNWKWSNLTNMFQMGGSSSTMSSGCGGRWIALLACHSMYFTLGFVGPENWDWMLYPPSNWWFPIGISFSRGLFSGAILVSGRVFLWKMTEIPWKPPTWHFTPSILIFVASVYLVTRWRWWLFCLFCGRLTWNKVYFEMLECDFSSRRVAHKNISGNIRI